MKQQDKLFVIIGAVAVLGVASVTGYILFTTKDSDTTRQSTTSQTASNSDTSNTTSQASGGSEISTYKDGSYKATVDYSVPEGGTNSIEVRLTVAGGRVTDVQTSSEYEERESTEYLDPFEGSIASVVTGQELNGLSISRVGGASLTSAAFNDVLETIRSDAKA